jgi:hypothetical protein
MTVSPSKSAPDKRSATLEFIHTASNAFLPISFSASFCLLLTVKIGISNRPEYRERTLQSEKPTIELLCAKQYPSRTIAEAIEGALHKAFGEKRLRGEWFNLSDQDVIDLKITLS